ncbi:MAG: sulfate/thiosulfate transport system ATP-binding protein [Gaiellales bacterium]|nr:sulfate/thiosulfate transport system ATP-binding protein [Gaiellales bacterium]MDX6544547.1 sulfate/thiosulfate transport system ATP-binding protein [Gaiellales bacterium]
MAGSIQVRGLTKSFGDFRAVDDVSFEAAEGTITALLGPSGSGKSTVLRMIAGLEQPDSGSVWVAGEELTDASVQDRRLGFVFQHYALFRHMTVRRNVAFGLSVRHVDKAIQKERVDELLELVGLAPFGHRYPDQLSGGQRQRVALARALAPRPKVLLLDEPFGALDARVRQELRTWLDHLHRELGVTSLFVTHDQEEALELANEIVVMNHGRIEQVGPAEEIYNKPATPFVAAFVGASNVLRGVVWERHVHFGHSVVAGAHEIEDGGEAVAYIRPHDIEITDTAGDLSFPVEVERRIDMGWMSKVHLRLEDGQPLIAQLPNEEIEGVSAGQRLFANLRNPKVFPKDLADRVSATEPDLDAANAVGDPRPDA